MGVKAGDDLHDGQTCCDGAMPYHAKGGSYCKAIQPACVKAGDDLHDGQTCCDGAMPYHANGGSYCKAIVLGEDSEASASEDPEGLNSTGLSAAAAGLWCTPVDGKCGGMLGPFKWHKKCCGNARCQKLFGSPDGTMKCVEKQPEQQCVPHHGECGGPGRQTLPCCAPRLSCRKQFFSEIMKCM